MREKLSPSHSPKNRGPRQKGRELSFAFDLEDRGILSAVDRADDGGGASPVSSAEKAKQDRILQEVAA